MSGLTEALLGQATTFTVDAAEAGEGTLELVVSTENNTVKAEVVACARGLYDVTFVPQTTSAHYVNISFNDDNVPGLYANNFIDRFSKADLKNNNLLIIPMYFYLRKSI